MRVPNYARFGLLLGLVSGGLGLFLILDPTQGRLLLFLLIGLVSLGTDHILRHHPHVPLSHPLPTLWILPTLLTIGAALSLPLITPRYGQALGVAFAGLTLGVAILAQYHALNPQDRRWPLARFALGLLTYLAAFGLFLPLYDFFPRLLSSVLAIGAASTLLAGQLFWQAGAAKGWLYAGVCGLILAEMRWGLDFWPVGRMVGGALLLLIFYLVTGVIQSYLARRLTKGTLIEFAAVTLVGSAFLLGWRLWAG